MRFLRKRRERDERTLDERTIEALLDDAARVERARIAAWLRQPIDGNEDQSAINRVMADMIETGRYLTPY